MDVRRRLCEKIVPALRGRKYLMFDETGFPKQGKHSVGVARQYCGTLGKVRNCQVAMSLDLATEELSVPIDWEMYLPEIRTEDPERRRKARIPEETVFRMKPEIALAELDRAKGWGLGGEIALADAVYGDSVAFRQGLIERGHAYAVGVQGTTAV